MGRNDVGEPIKRIKTAWRATCRRADIQDLHFHDLRREFASRLLEELGSVPGAETQALAERVRHERPIRPAAIARSPELGEGEPRIPLVGREVELTRLAEAAEQACRERRACGLVLEGDSGSGKTRLLEELLGRLRLDGVAVAAVRAVEADREEEWSGILGLARSGLLSSHTRPSTTTVMTPKTATSAVVVVVMAPNR